MKPNKLLMIISTICIHTISIAQNYGPPQGPPPNNQENDIIQPSGYISVNFGFATPEGGFANSGNSYGGDALPGDVFHFSIGVPINHSNFGIAFMFGNYNNQYNLNAYANNNSEYAIYPNQNYYSENSIMVGLYTTYPFGRFSLDGRFMIGALLSGLPEQNVGYNDVEGDSYENDLQPSNSTSLAFDAGVGIRCLLAQFGRRKLCAMINVDYLYSNVSYNTEENQYEVPATGPNAGYQVQFVPSPTFSGTLPIELLNVTFGLGYQL